MPTETFRKSWNCVAWVTTKLFFAHSGLVVARTATMQAMLVKLEQSGLIERRPDTEHGRIQRTELTEKGWSSLAQAHLAAQKSERLAREASTPDAVEMLTRVAKALA